MKEGHYRHMTDQKLLERFYNDRNNEWLGVLLQRYTLLLLGVCMKYLKNEEDAKDAVQQIFLKVIEELQKYRVDYFKSWLYMVARNYCLMKLRNKKGTILQEINVQLWAKESRETNMEILLENEKALMLMNESLKQLNPQQQQCITLFYLKKKSYHEVSETTGYSMLQVKSYIQNGKRNLRIMLEKKLKEKKY